MERPSHYPRTYTVRADTLRALDAVAGIPVALVIAITLLQLAGLVAKPMRPDALLAAGFVAGVLTVAMWNLNHRRVLLYEDSIAVRSWLSCRRLNQTEILGRRMGKLPWQAGGGSFYIIVPLDSSRRELRLPPFLHLDQDFLGWIRKIPVLDEQPRVKEFQ